MSTFAVLGLHDEQVKTVVNADGSPRNVLRVRKTVQQREIDEDFELPVLPASVPHTVDVYTAFLTPVIMMRMAGLDALPPEQLDTVVACNADPFNAIVPLIKV